MQASKSAFAALIDIFVDPKKAIYGQDQNLKWLWWPIVLVLLSAIATWVWYYQIVDIDFLIQDFIAQQGEVTPEQRDAMESSMSPGLMMTMTVVFIPVVMLIV